jgi:hypothetical protein
LADGFLRYATEPNAVLGAYADGRAIEARPLFGGGMTTRSIALSAIRVGKRHRKDLGDIRSLARSIQEIGSGLKPRPGHLQENLALSIRSGGSSSVQTFVGISPKSFRRRNDTSQLRRFSAPNNATPKAGV